jgi:hypothetical protein
MNDDDWEDPFDNDDDNDDPYYIDNNIFEIGFFEYERGDNHSWTNDREYFMKDHLTYVLGSHVLLLDQDKVSQLYHGTSILLKTFYEFPLSNILSYLRWKESSFTFEKPPLQMKLHILQLFVTIIQEEPFQFETKVVIKTFWLSLIQRHWKKIIKKRKDFILKMKTNSFLIKREIHLKYSHLLKSSLKGMLSEYKK